MSSRHSGSLSVIDSSICGPDFIKTKGYRWSNLGCWRRDGRPTVTRSAGAAQPRWRGRPTAAAHQSKLLPALRSTKHDMVFTYGIRATRGTHFAHLGTAVEGDGGWRQRCLPFEPMWQQPAPLAALQRWGVHRWKRWTSWKLLGWSAWHRRQHTSAAVS
jgi:hypothetical protein